MHLSFAAGPRTVPLLLLAGILLGCAAAEAGESKEEGSATVVNGSPEAVVVVGRSGTIGSWSGSGSSGGRTWTCGYYEVARRGGEGSADSVVFDSPVDPTPGEAYVFACFQNGQLVQSRILQFDPGDPLAGVAAAERARDEARRRLDLPLPEPRVNPPGAQLVGVPTWLWLDGAWGEASATAAVGNVAATVTARPVQATWTTGDGATVTCDAGVPYDPGRPPSQQASSCTHTYTRASTGQPGGAYTVRVSVTYEVGWSSTTGAGGGLGGVTRETTFPLAVEQAQAVIR